MRVQLNVLHNIDAFLDEKRAGAAYIDLASLQHPYHPAPGSILAAISPGVRDVKSHPVARACVKSESVRLLRSNNDAYHFAVRVDGDITITRDL